MADITSTIQVSKVVKPDGDKKPTKIYDENGVMYSGFDASMANILTGATVEIVWYMTQKGDKTYNNVKSFTIKEQGHSQPAPEQTDWARKDELNHRRAVLDTMLSTGCYFNDCILDRELLKADFNWAMDLIYTSQPVAQSVIKTGKTAYESFIDITAGLGWDDDDRGRYIHAMYPNLSWKQLTDVQKAYVAEAVKKHAESM